MMQIPITQRELERLKTRLNTTIQAHRLLKGKLDELRRLFRDISLRCRKLRTVVDTAITDAHRSLAFASAFMSPQALEQSLLRPIMSAGVEFSYKNIMSLKVPVYKLSTGFSHKTAAYPYGFAQTSGELDDAVSALSNVLDDMLELAQAEKTLQLLSAEIEKTQRRVNALEHILIPKLRDDINRLLV